MGTGEAQSGERNSSEVKAGALGSFVKNSDDFQVNRLISSVFILINFVELFFKKKQKKNKQPRVNP